MQTNSSVHLTCGPRTHAHISWVKGSPESGIHSLPSDEGVNTTGGELDIVHFRARDHAGLYFCVSNDTNGLFRSCPARITHASEWIRNRGGGGGSGGGGRGKEKSKGRNEIRGIKGV